MRTPLRRLSTFFHSPDVWVFLVFSLVLFGCIFGPLFYLFFTVPAGLSYRFADGFYFDYYHYLAMIKTGMMGIPYFVNRYTELLQPPSFGHAFFSMIGLVGALFTNRSDIVYLVARIVALLVFFGVYFVVVRRYISSFIHRIVAYTILFTSTSFYTVTQTAGGFRAIEPITFSSCYNALQKFSTQPHHILAGALLLSVVLLFTSIRFTWKKYVTLVVVALSIGLMHPIDATVGILSILLMWAVMFFVNKKEAMHLLVPVIVFSIASAVPIGYYSYLFSHVPPWTTWHMRTFEYNFQIGFFDFVRANGFFLPFLLLFVPVFRKYPRIATFLFGWGVVFPVLLFPFAQRGMGITLPRLLQVQQYIPLSILSGMGLSLFLSQFKRTLQYVIVSFFCVSAVCFAAIPWKSAIEDSFFWKQYTYFNVFLSDDFLSALNYLEKQTPSETVVLASEYVSSMIPAFTHNRVILGRGDAADDYATKLIEAQMFFAGNQSPEHMKRFLDRYRINYIVFGIDGPSFAPTYSDVPFLRTVFTSGNITVVSVIR